MFHSDEVEITVIQTGKLPDGALLERYEQQEAYTDCYYMELPGHISHSEYVEAFYTSSLFKAERAILAIIAARQSTDEQAREMANGMRETFSSWSVEGRTENQLLLCDHLGGRTRSWLMSAVTDGDNGSKTRLYFGSAVVPLSISASGKKSFGFGFHALLGFHRLYSRALMRSMLSRLSKLRRG